MEKLKVKANIDGSNNQVVMTPYRIVREDTPKCLIVRMPDL